MQQSLITAGMLAGGLGLFMLAVSMITDGLKSTAGHALRHLLGKWTRSPAHGVLTGLTITAIVQSSSAVTVATIGFVNAGLISMHKSLGIIYGANIGTTMTGWLVAIIGFKVNVEAFALPMIGVGMLLRLTGGETRRAHLGLALAGFGLFFIGIDVLRDAFGGLVGTFDLAWYADEGIAGLLLFTGIGFLMTVFTQSSSAAIAITLTAATSGVLELDAAAAMVVGTNVGTTSTAAVAVIGATSNAKRVAAAHIIFNLMTGIIALMSLPLLFWTVQYVEDILGLEAIPAVTLAMFHTIFNILGVLLIFPLNRRLAHFLDRLFVTQEEIEGRPRYLDKTVAVSPELAVNALAMELSRITTVVQRLSLESLSSEFDPSVRIRRDYIVARKLSSEVAKFIAHLERGMLNSEISEQLTRVLRTDQHLLTCAQQAMEVAKMQADVRGVEDVKIMQAISHFRAEVVELLKMADPEQEDFSFSCCESQLEEVQLAYETVRADLLQAGAELRIPIPEMINILEQNSRIRRMPRQMVKAMQYLSELSMMAEVRTPEPEIEPGQESNTDTEKQDDSVTQQK